MFGGWHHQILFALAAAPRTEAEALHQRHVFLCAGWFFLVVTLILAASVVHPEWRKYWRWGTMKTGTPMTAVGRVAWIFAFAVCGASCLTKGWGNESELLIILMVAAFGFLLCAAWYDSWQFKRQTQKK
jgi:hypothetical protein